MHFNQNTDQESYYKQLIKDIHSFDDVFDMIVISEDSPYWGQPDKQMARIQEFEDHVRKDWSVWDIDLAMGMEIYTKKPTAKDLPGLYFSNPSMRFGYELEIKYLYQEAMMLLGGCAFAKLFVVHDDKFGDGISGEQSINDMRSALPKSQSALLLQIIDNQKQARNSDARMLSQLERIDGVCAEIKPEIREATKEIVSTVQNKDKSESRRHNNITQKEVSVLVEKTERTVQNWESGKNTPSGYSKKLRNNHEAFTNWLNTYLSSNKAKLNFKKAVSYRECHNYTE